MPENLRFQSEDEIKEQETLERLKEEGGIYFRQETNPENGETTNFVNILGIEVETYASEEDIESIKKEMILSPVDQDLLRTIAQCYKLRQPLLFEGDPGAGKTFLIEKLTKLVHGKDAPVLELVGTPRTSELEILGHWAPKGLKEKESQEYKEILKDVMGKGELAEFQKHLNEELEKLNADFSDGKINQEEFQAGFGEISQKYVEESRKILLEASQMAKFLKPEAEWEFKQGALLQAYAGKEGKGYPLIVDEFNIIPSNYQQIFLQISGREGGMSDAINFWGNSGKTSYKRGKDAWIAFASNFPEKTPGRSEVVAPMTDRLVWKVIPTEDVTKKKGAIKKTAGGRLTKRTAEVSTFAETEIPVENNVEWDKVLDEQLGEQIADIVDLLDTEFVKSYEQVGDTLNIKGEQRRRNQSMEFSGRNPLRLYSYLDNFQVRDKKTGFVDFAATLLNAFEMYYVSRLANEATRKKMDALFHQIMEGDTGKAKFEGQARTRKEILAILSERASLTPEVAEQMEEQSKGAQEREILQARHVAEDAEGKLLNNPNIPEELKRMLRGEK